MDFYVMSKSYNRYGGHTTFSQIGRFLLGGRDNFGGAIIEILVTLHFPDSGPVQNSLELLKEKHTNYRSTLPKITYRRTSKKIAIEVASNILDGKDWFGSPIISLPMFRQGVDEVIQALQLIKKRLTNGDDFDFGAFIDHCDASKDGIPESESALQDLVAELRAADKAKRDAMSPWEKLGIDWEDFHPKSREILDDPFFWECSNEFSPNGNDTGADLLGDYRSWLKKNKDGKPMQFLETLVKRWGYKDIEEVDDDLRGEAAIGLAFADLKLRAVCDQNVRQFALDAIGRQRAQALSDVEWEHRMDRPLDKIEIKIRTADDFSNVHKLLTS